MSKKKNLFVLILCGLLFFAFAVGSSQVDEEGPKASENGSTEEKKEVTYKKISVDTLEDALEENAAAAKEKYNGKYLEITGKLGTIDSDLKYISLVSQTDEWDFTGIHCTLKNDKVRDQVKKLKKKQKITVRGKVTDVGEVLGYYLDAYEIIVPKKK